MAYKIPKHNFKSQLYQACGNDDLRPQFEFVHFDKGYAFASDGHVAVKSKLSEHGFSEEEIEHINGNQLHKDVMKEIMRFPFVEITKTGIKIEKGDSTILFKWAFQDKGKKPSSITPMVDKVFKDFKKNPVEEIAFNINFMSLAKKVLVLENLETIILQFQAENMGIMVKSIAKGSGQFFLVMPVMNNTD